MKLIVPGIAALAWLAVVAMTALNPSGTIPKSPPAISAWTMLLGGIPLVLVLLFRATITRSSLRSFLFWFGVSCVFTVTTTVFAAVRYHRDYYTLLFQFALLFFIVFLVGVPHLNIVRNRRRVFRTLEHAGWAVFFCFSLWVGLMGYTIVTRSEPRWIEATVYNFMACVILVVQVASISILHERSHKTLIHRDGSFYLDGRSLCELFTPRQSQILERFFTAPDSICTCTSFTGSAPSIPPDALQEALQEAEEVVPVDSASASSFAPSISSPDFPCERCIEQGWSAVNCRFYRNIKNQLLQVKKYLELLEIGTIINAAENYRDNKTAGWKLRLFDDVRYRAKPR